MTISPLVTLPSEIIAHIFRYLPVDVVSLFQALPSTAMEACERMHADVMVNPYHADDTRMSYSLTFPQFWDRLPTTSYGCVELIVEHVEEFHRVVAHADTLNLKVRSLRLYVELHLSDFNSVSNQFQKLHRLQNLSIKLNNGQFPGAVDYAHFVVPPVTFLDLSANENSISSFAGLVVPASVVKLNLSQNNLSERTRVCVFPETLKVLDVSESRIHDLSVMALPVGLENLNLFNNRVASFGAFRLPEGLRHLNLSRNKLTQLSTELAHLTNLKDLRMVTQNTARERLDVSSLVLPSGLELLAYCNEHQDLDIFTKIPAEIKDLYLSFTPFGRLPSSLARFDRLERLHLGFAELHDVEGVKFPRSLRVLNLMLNQLIRILRHISELPNLQELNLSQNQIESVSNCKFGPRLRTLVLDGNRLTRIPKVLRLNLELRTLTMAGNPLSTDFFAHLPPNLTVLDASGVEISHPVVLPPGLVSLVLKGSNLERLADLPLPPTLTHLDLSGNRLRTIEPGTQFPTALTHVNLTTNQIDDRQQAEICQRFSGVVIDMSNPLPAASHELSGTYEEELDDDASITEDVMEIADGDLGGV